MGTSFNNLQPEELTEFRKVNTSIENIEIPACPESRYVTDRKGFLFFGIVIVIFLPFFIYTLIMSDLRRIKYDYDDCGNMCGQRNPKIDGILCSGVDYTLKPYSNRSLQRSDDFHEKFSCLAYCPHNTDTHYLPNRCTPKKYNNLEVNRRYGGNKYRRSVDFMDEDNDFSISLEDCRKSWWKFLVVLFITIVLSLMMLYLMRFTPAVLVWGIISLSLLLALGISIGLWYGYFKTEDKDRSVFLIGAVIVSIFTLIIILVCLCLFRKIRLVILLFKEATKAVFSMPLIILVPVLTVLIQLVILTVCVFTTLLMLTSRELQKYSEDYYEYEPNGVMTFTMIFNFIMTIWALEFVTGFQYMTIAGSVASWFFSKNKQYLGLPIWTSFLNAIRFHTGTIAFGSFILVLMAIVRAVVRSLCNNEKLRCVVECCCANIEAFLKFLSKNSYIETAIHGQSFLRSGRRAAKLLLSNAGSVIAINSVGDFVLGMIQFLIVVISTGIAVILFKDLQEFWLPSVICLILNIIIVVIIFSVFSTIIDTLFICFCEDKTINDGISRPYYMSRGLMEFIENSKKVYGDK